MSHIEYIESLMTQQVSIVTETLDEFNEFTKATKTSKAWIDEAASVERDMETGEQRLSRARVFLPPDAVITPEDNIIIDSSGKEYAIRSIATMRTSNGVHHFEVDLV